jgi:hypothetical protein
MSLISSSEEAWAVGQSQRDYNPRSDGIDDGPQQALVIFEAIFRLRELARVWIALDEQADAMWARWNAPLDWEETALVWMPLSGT